MTSAGDNDASTLCHPAPLTEDRRGVRVAGPRRGIPASALNPLAAVDQGNNSSKSAEPTGFIRYRSIPTSRASSRPGCSL